MFWMSVKQEVMPFQLKYSNRFCGLQSSVVDTGGLEEDVVECSEVTRKPGF